MNIPVQSLWIGPRLSTMERLCIASFLANGHTFHLYAYDEIVGVPAGTSLMDASAILPRSKIFRYSGNGSLAGFSNFFRYKMLLENGGWWVDMDTICLRHFEFQTDYVFSSEICRAEIVPDLAALKAPSGSPLAQYAWDVCNSKDPGQLRWGETGPRLLANAISRFALESYMQPPEVFCPVDYPDWKSVLDPGSRGLGPGPAAVHFWNEMWRDAGMDKDANYDAHCLFERLKTRFLGSNK